jgi:hypothetical protein
MWDVQHEAEAVAATTEAISDDKKDKRQRQAETVATAEHWMAVEQEIAEQRDRDACAPPVIDLTQQQPELLEVKAEPFREHTPEFEERPRASFVIGEEEPLEAGGASAYPIPLFSLPESAAAEGNATLPPEVSPERRLLRACCGKALRIVGSNRRVKPHGWVCFAVWVQ